MEPIDPRKFQGFRWALWLDWPGPREKYTTSEVVEILVPAFDGIVYEDSTMSLRGGVLRIGIGREFDGATGTFDTVTNLLASVVHDCLYHVVEQLWEWDDISRWRRYQLRKMADAEMEEIMQAQGAVAVHRGATYVVLRPLGSIGSKVWGRLFG